MKQSNYISINERRLLIVSVVVSVLVSQLADNLAKDVFSTFYQQTILGKLIFLVVYVGMLIVLSALIIFPLFKIFKLRI